MQDQIYEPYIVVYTIILDIIILVMLLVYFLNLAIFINSIWRLTMFLTDKKKIIFLSMAMSSIFMVAYTNEICIFLFFYWGAPAHRMVRGSEKSHIYYCIPYDSEGNPTGPFKTFLTYI